MRADQFQAVLSLVMLFAVLAVLVVVVQGQKTREANRDAAVVRIQACMVQMLLVDESDRATFTTEDFERLCPGVRDVLEEGR